MTQQALKLGSSTHLPRLAPGSRPHPDVAIAPVPVPATLERDIFHLLRRRHRSLVTFVFLGVLLGGAMGYGLWSPTYTSKGLIQVTSSAPASFSQQGQAPVPLYDTFITSQVALLSSQQNLRRAVQDPAWRSFSQTSSVEEELQSFARQVEVSRVPGSELISVGFSHPDPEVARAGVKAVLDAYVATAVEQDSQERAKQTQILQDRRTQLVQQADALRKQILAIGAGYGCDDLEQLYLLELQDLSRLASLRREAQEALAGADQEPQDGNVDQTSLRQMAAFDPVMRQYLKEKLDLERAVGELSRRLGPNHHSLIEARNNLAFLDKAVERYAGEMKASGRYMVTNTLPGVAGIPAVATVEHVRDRAQRISNLYQQTLSTTVDLGRKNLQAKELRAQADDVHQALTEMDRRIEQIALDGENHGVSSRIRIISSGDAPVCPVAKSPKTMALVGGLVGAVAGLGLLMLLGFSDPRLRSFEEVRSVLGRVPVVGILPALPRQAAGSARAAAAARAIRQLSSWLQIWRGAGDRRVLAITSPTAGDGKTSLTLALGAALAEAGCRTLLIDCDLAGKGLSARSEELSGSAVDGGISSALRGPRSAGSGESVAGALHLADAGSGEHGTEDMAGGQAAVAPCPAGLAEALRGEPLEKCVVATHTSGLFVLPVASSTAGESLSLMALRRLVGRARKQFDMILIDTGPICASSEAPLVAEEADGALLAVSRGDRRDLVKGALEQLASIEAKVIGVVYNRAAHRDAQAVGSAVRSGGGSHRRGPSSRPPESHRRKPAADRWPTAAATPAAEAPQEQMAESPSGGRSA